MAKVKAKSISKVSPAPVAAVVGAKGNQSVSLSSRHCDAAEAEVWDVTYDWDGEPRCERGFRSEEAALACASRIADAYGLSVEA